MFPIKCLTMKTKIKPRSVKTKIKRLIKTHGSRKNVAEILNVELSYIYKLEKNTIPGWRLYRDIYLKYDKSKL